MQTDGVLRDTSNPTNIDSHRTDPALKCGADLHLPSVYGLGGSTDDSPAHRLKAFAERDHRAVTDRRCELRERDLAHSQSPGGRVRRGQEAMPAAKPLRFQGSERRKSVPFLRNPNPLLWTGGKHRQLLVGMFSAGFQRMLGVSPSGDFSALDLQLLIRNLSRTRSSCVVSQVL